MALAATAALLSPAAAAAESNEGSDAQCAEAFERGQELQQSGRLVAAKERHERGKPDAREASQLPCAGVPIDRQHQSGWNAST